MVFTSSLEVAEISRDVALISVVVAAISLAVACCSFAVAAISVGLVSGVPCLDLAYAEDSCAEVDMNVVMTGSGRFVEVQGAGEGVTFAESDLRALLRLARLGIRRVVAVQHKLLSGSGLLPAAGESAKSR